SSIQAVTVFPRGAQITRTATIPLEAGVHTLIFSDLTQHVIPNSIRVEGAFDGAVEIGSIDTRKIFINNGTMDQSERKRIKAEIERLQDEIATLNNTVRAANTQISLLQNLASLPAQAPKAASSSAPSPDWQQILNLIGGMDPVLERVHKAQIRQRELGREIDKLNKQLSMHQPRPDRRTEVRVHVKALQAARGTLSIRYQVNSGSWTPFYDMRLDTGSKTKAPALQLVRRAAISQNSGEDWKNVALTLSTSRPQASTSAPRIRPMQIIFKPEPVVLGRAFPMTKRAMRPAPGMEDMLLDEAAPAPAMRKRQKPRPRKAREREARIQSYGFQALFEIAGKVTVTSGTAGKKVRIGSASPDVRLKVRTVPRLDTTAYLYADMKWKGKTALLPGRISLYRDGAYTGAGSIPLINPGEDHELGFGADDRVKVKRVQLAREKSVSGLISRSRVDVQDYKITLKNLHERTVPVTLLDQIPYSEDEQIKVTLLPETTKPTRTDDHDRRGVLA
ncbi:MAG TPA: mucoidy inhibitor MuiA family protein, partial [Rhizobiales bacterium]|nr:mucoidy inhibitor MuiA family protein [Hyphomicrobiales bacterium]